MNKEYDKTLIACFIGYIVQAIVNNFIPLLFVTFHKSMGISLSNITLLITFNFCIQLLVDLLSISFVDKIGYRVSMVIAHICAVAGLVGLTILPNLFSSPFIGLLISVMIYAIGGGLLEVLVSPIVEACPTDNKEMAMSLLHSFYCFGHVGVVLISSLFFFVFGIENWRILAIIWATVPFVNIFLFMIVPIASLNEEGERGLSLKELFSNKIFIAFLIMMICAGASEQAVSQWASSFAELGLGVSKAIGDLAGPMSFAFFMGLARAFYGKYGEKINLDRFMIFSTFLCIISYLIIFIIPYPIISLMACSLTGFSVGIMWPGTFSKAAKLLKRGGTAMFAFLALAGDVGCSLGPTVVGFVSARFNENLKLGIFAAVVFPIGLLLGISYILRKE